MIDWRVGQLPEALAEFPENTFHACLTDTPYGLSDPPPPDLLLRWLAGEEVEHGSGFLARSWDSLPPGPDFWRELYHVLRPGALVMAFSHSRTFDLQTMAMRMGGFEILPAFAWLHAESQALGSDVGKLIDRAAGEEREVVGDSPYKSRASDASSSTQSGPRGMVRDITAPATPLAQLFDGHHTRLRTNWEPVCVAMKPIDGTWAENAARWGCGGFNAEASRIPTVSAADDAAYAGIHASVEGISREDGTELQGGTRDEVRTDGYSPTGRFPSCVLQEHSVDCEVGACVPGCPCAVLAEQGIASGVHSAGPIGFSPKADGNPGNELTCGMGNYPRQSHRFGDGASANRFYFQARPGRRERSAGCEGLFWKRSPEHPDGWELIEGEEWALLHPRDRFEGNPNPCLKSLELTRYLAKLLRQPGEARLLVPFCGSGSEAIGAVLGGWRHVAAIDGSSQCLEAARRREAFWGKILASGAVGSIRELLGENTPPRARPVDGRQASLFP